MGAMNAAMTNSAAAAAAALNHGKNNSLAVGIGAFREYSAISATYARKWSDRVRTLLSVSGNSGEGVTVGAGISIGW
jgi:autotransporter adhesin